MNYPVDGNKGAADISIPLYTVPDPMAEKYYGVNAYGYCAGNPVMMVDPDGRSTYVKDEGNGRYRVIGGDIEDDRGFYL